MRETFDAQIVYLALHDRRTGLIKFPYYMEGDECRIVEPILFGEGLTTRIIESRQPLLLTQEQHFADLKIARVGTRSKSLPGRADHSGRPFPAQSRRPSG